APPRPRRGRHHDRLPGARGGGAAAAGTAVEAPPPPRLTAREAVATHTPHPTLSRRGPALSRPEPRFGLALRVPDCLANGLRTGGRDEPLLRGRARNRGGSPELPHHQGNSPLRLPLAVCALYLPEPLERLVDPSIEDGGQLLAPAERPRRGERNGRADLPTGGRAGDPRSHEWALVHTAVACLALRQTDARDFELGIGVDFTVNDRSHSRALEGTERARNFEVAEEQRIGVAHAIDVGVLRRNHGHGPREGRDAASGREMHADAEDQRGGRARSVEVRERPQREDLARDHVAEGEAGERQGTGERPALVVAPGDAGRVDAGSDGWGRVVARGGQTSAGLEEVSGQHGAVEEARDGSGVARGGGLRRRGDRD